MDFEFVDQLNVRFAPVGITFSTVARDQTYYLIVKNTQLDRSVWELYIPDFAQGFKGYLRPYFEPKAVQQIDSNTVEYTIGSVFDLIKEINPEKS